MERSLMFGKRSKRTGRKHSGTAPTLRLSTDALLILCKNLYNRHKNTYKFIDCGKGNKILNERQIGKSSRPEPLEANQNRLSI